MSLKYLLYAECFYFDHDPAYRATIRTILKEKGWPLRRADNNSEIDFSTIGLDTMVKSRARGYMPGRRRKFRRKEVIFA